MFKLQLGLRIEETVAEEVWTLGILVLLQTSGGGRWETDAIFHLQVLSSTESNHRLHSPPPPPYWYFQNISLYLLTQRIKLK